MTDHEFELYGYSDSDWVSSIPDRKSTLTYCFSLGSSMVSWSSKKQWRVALNTTEAKYMAASLESCEAIWLRKLLAGLFGQVLGAYGDLLRQSELYQTLEESSVS